jgi:hypothetical protein
MRIFGVITACVLFSFGGTNAHAISSEKTSAYTSIAVCLGRFSAQIEHAHLMGTEVADATARHNHFSELYDALGGTTQLLSLRIAQKTHHARLLQIATFNQDPRRRQMAARQAQMQISSCEQLALS